MKTLITILSTAGLLLGLVSTAAAQYDDCGDTALDPTQGECSAGVGIPSRESLRNAILAASDTRLQAMLDHSERALYYDLIPDAINRLMTSDNARTREWLAWWLRRQTFAVDIVFTYFANALQTDTDSVRRARAAEALGELMIGSSVSLLSDAVLNDADAEVRRAAVAGLGRLNRTTGYDAIAAALADSDALVVAEALRSTLLVNRFSKTEDVIAVLDDADAANRRNAALVLGQYREASAAPALEALLTGDPDRDVRAAAAWSLGRLGEVAVLRAAMPLETDSIVLNSIEIAQAL